MRLVTKTILFGCGKFGIEVFSYSPSEPKWWITGFNPEFPMVIAEFLTVEGSIDFSSHPEMYNGLENAYEN